VEVGHGEGVVDDAGQVGDVADLLDGLVGLLGLHELRGGVDDLVGFAEGGAIPAKGSF
jgi:hypothetical protein